jgi:hypothetical protein
MNDREMLVVASLDPRRKTLISLMCRLLLVGRLNRTEENMPTLAKTTEKPVLHVKGKIRSRITDISGQKFNMLTPILPIAKNGKGLYWLFLCDCGRTKSIRWDSVVREFEPVRSCGCQQSEQHGMTYSPEWWSYISAKGRCTQPTTTNYNNYGGRGIEFRFASFDEFYKHLGPRLEGLTLDRIDPNGHYEIGNVRWATDRVQAQNKRQYTTIDRYTDAELISELEKRSHATYFSGN